MFKLFVALTLNISLASCFQSLYTKNSTSISEKKLEQMFNTSSIDSMSVLIGNHKKVLFYKNLGNAHNQSFFDLASLTKVITSLGVMKLIQQKKLTLRTPLNSILRPIYSWSLRVEHLLRHTSGFRAGLYPEEQNRKSLLSLKPSRKRGRFKYSDINFLLLGIIIEKVSGKKLNNFLNDEILRPLTIKDGGFLPNQALDIQPTTLGVNPGVVHDPTSQAFGGITGHAGIFLKTIDLAKIGALLLNKSSHCYKKALIPYYVKQMTSYKKPNLRGLGVDINSPYSKAPRSNFFTKYKSFGHTGYTGTSIWIDPKKNLFAIFLSNSTYSHDMKKTKKEFYKILESVTQSIK